MSKLVESFKKLGEKIKAFFAKKKASKKRRKSRKRDNVYLIKQEC